MTLAALLPRFELRERGRSIVLSFGQRCGLTQGVVTILRQLLVQGGPFHFVGVHVVRNWADFLGRIARDNAAIWPDAACFEKGQCANDASRTDLHVVHDDRIHADEALSAKLRPMDNGTVPDMRARRHVDGGSREHVHDTVFLDIAAFGQFDASPITPEDGSSPHETIRTNGHMSDDHRVGMDKCRGVHHGYHAFEGLDHRVSVFSMTVA